MAFTTPGESPLRCRQNNRKVSHGHEVVAVIKERTPQPGNLINLRAMLCGGNSEPERRRRAQKAADMKGPRYACFAARETEGRKSPQRRVLLFWTPRFFLCRALKLKPGPPTPSPPCKFSYCFPKESCYPLGTIYSYRGSLTMKLIQVRLRNFRCFKGETSIAFEDLTALIGRNEAGKSTVMDALDLFFNEGTPDKHDACKHGDASDVAVIAVFADLPDRLVLDQEAETTLQGEYLLNSKGNLEIQKVFNCRLEKPKLLSLKLVAVHPTVPTAGDLILLSNSELKKRAKDLGADTSNVDLTINAQLRDAIRARVGDLELKTVDVSLQEGNGENVWKGIQAKLPVYALFQSDRKSTDQDPEAQDPLTTAVKEAIRQREQELGSIAKYVEGEVRKIADLTLKKLREMDPSLARTLNPKFEPPKWAGIFKVSITGDEDIPINKRGSGVRRLILLNFFRAKAEQKMGNNKKQNAIFAIEEPETSQHPHNQRLLMSALQELAGKDQVIITTHTPMLARTLPVRALRFVDIKPDNSREILTGGDEATNNLIATSLGVLRDHNVKLFIAVEGKTDIAFLKNISRVLVAEGVDVPDLEKHELDGEIIFVELGGENLVHWAYRLEPLNLREFHLYDRNTAPLDPPQHQQTVDEVNARPRCRACSTNKLEIENYVHRDAINDALSDQGMRIAVPGPVNSFEDLPAILVRAVNEVAPPGDRWGRRRAKEFLCGVAASRMTKAMLDEIDPTHEVLGWFHNMREMIQQNL
jgi:putative ATP-dependent endonuclease of the OLD family